MVPKEDKEFLWEEVKKCIRFPTETQEKAQRATLKTLTTCLCNFKSMLNVEYVKKNHMPFADFGKIKPGKWIIFIQWKTSDKALAISEAYEALNRKNKYKHPLGPSRYKKKIPKWRRKKEENCQAEKRDPLEGVQLRGRN